MIIKTFASTEAIIAFFFDFVKFQIKEAIALRKFRKKIDLYFLLFKLSIIKEIGSVSYQISRSIVLKREI